MKHPPLVELERLLLREEGFVIRLRQTRLGQQLSSIRQTLLALVRETTRSGNLPLIIALELEVIRGDLLRYANSQGMVNSLKLAEEELEAAQRHLELVGTPKATDSSTERIAFARNVKTGSLSTMRGAP